MKSYDELLKENELLKRENRALAHIGYEMIKTALRYCPYKMKEVEQ